MCIDVDYDVFVGFVLYLWIWFDVVGVEVVFVCFDCYIFGIGVVCWLVLEWMSCLLVVVMFILLEVFVLSGGVVV